MLYSLERYTIFKIKRLLGTLLVSSNLFLVQEALKSHKKIVKNQKTTEKIVKVVSAMAVSE